MSANIFLKNVWYYGTPSSTVVTGKMKTLEILGDPVLFFRDTTGKAFAIRDICPHRGIPLSYGRMVGDQVECPYHGWKFQGDGTCTEIPSLCEGQELDCRKIKVRSYPVTEKQGNIWIFVGDKDFDVSKAPPVPDLPNFSNDVHANMFEVENFPCHLDHAVIGLMDPAHGPFIHRSWFWRNERSIHAKRKMFAPVDFGFQMVRHQPSKNSKAYKILGGQPTTEITFSLPSVRIEHVQVGNKNFCALTALTPVNANNTRIHQLSYWDMPWLTAIKPVLRKFIRVFLFQDIDAVKKQQEGLRFDPTLMLIKDADTQAKWYFSLKNEWHAADTEKRTFTNPVKPTELQWRS